MAKIKVQPKKAAKKAVAKPAKKVASSSKGAVKTAEKKAVNKKPVKKSNTPAPSAKKAVVTAKAVKAAKPANSGKVAKPAKVAIPVKKKEVKAAAQPAKAPAKASSKKEAAEKPIVLAKVPAVATKPLKKGKGGKSQPVVKRDTTGLPVLKRNPEPEKREEREKNRPSHSPVSKYIRFELEYPFHTTPGLLFEFFSEPSGLQEWFCNDVNVKGDIYIFFWDGSQQQAVLQKKREDDYARFRWLDEPEDTFFEFRIEIDELTRDVALIVTDFAEDEESKETSTRLWNAQIEKLHQILGAY